MVNPTGYTALDLIGFTDKGTYSSSDNYVKNDLVHYSGNIWRCLIDDTTGITPAEGVNWTLFIGEPTNLVEAAIASIEQTPSTSAYTVGRRLFYNDILYEVIATIAVGDNLVAYEDDPTNANIKVSAKVEEQIDSINNALTNVEDNLSHQNLLDNPWFTVNQRGQSSYASGSARYTVDRWQASSAESVTVNSNKTVTLSVGSSLGFFQQYLENDLRDNLLGKTVTVSAIVDDVLYSDTFTMPATVQSAYQVGAITIGDMVLRFRFSSASVLCFYFEHTANSSNSYTVKAVKLELGSVSTLAMDTAPNYAEELLKCQRYYYRLGNNSGNYEYTLGVAVSDHRVIAPIKLPVEMRTAPTISYSNIFVYGNSTTSGSSTIALTSLSGGLIKDVYNLYMDNSNNTFVTWASYMLRTESGHIDFSADL